MKRYVAFLAILAAAVLGSSHGGQKKTTEPDKTPTPASTAALLQALNQPLGTDGFQTPMSFKEFVGLLYEKKPFPMVVNSRAFKEENPDAGDILETIIRFPPLLKTMKIVQALDHAVGHIPGGGATFLLRNGQVEITTRLAASKEFLYNQTFIADFKKRPLEEALEELADLSGVSIIIDGRVKEKGLHPVSARFRNDVAMQDAVRMLVEMADLKLVYLVTGLYVTTPEHARAMQKELKDLYEGPPIMPGAGPQPGCGPGGCCPGAVPLDPLLSPLTPPLPPSRKAREAGV